MYEHFFQCPHCWENISMLVDTSVIEQTYIEDCEVCCNPIEIKVTFHDNVMISFEIMDLGQ